MTESHRLFNEALFEASKQRDGLFNTALTISGGALILSLSFVQYFSFEEYTAIMLKMAWLFSTVSIISNILMRKSCLACRYLDLTKQLMLIKGSYTSEELDELLKEHKPSGRISEFLGKWFEIIFWISFVSGLICLLCFAWMNV